MQSVGLPTTRMQPFLDAQSHGPCTESTYTNNNSKHNERIKHNVSNNNRLRSNVSEMNARAHESSVTVGCPHASQIRNSRFNYNSNTNSNNGNTNSNSHTD